MDPTVGKNPVSGCKSTILNNVFSRQCMPILQQCRTISAQLTGHQHDFSEVIVKLNQVFQIAPLCNIAHWNHTTSLHPYLLFTASKFCIKRVRQPPSRSFNSDYHHRSNGNAKELASRQQSSSNTQTNLTSSCAAGTAMLLSTKGQVLCINLLRAIYKQVF